MRVHVDTDFLVYALSQAGVERNRLGNPGVPHVAVLAKPAF